MTGLAPRLLCVKTLVGMEQSGKYGNLALHSALGGAALSAQEKRLCTVLFQGTLERLITLDACIAAHSSRPPAKMDPQVRAVLRCGICELLTLHTQEAAAVNLWTECVKKLHKTSAAGMVNAILRAFLRGEKVIPCPDDPIAAVSVKYSVPEPLVRQMTADYGAAEAEAFFADSLGEPPIYLRQNPLRCTEEMLLAEGNAERIEEIPFAFRLLRGQDAGIFTASAAFADGWFHVQDLASQLTCLALDAQPGETVLDVCAAPGGKTFTIAEMTEDRGQIYAYDLHENRVRLIRDGAKRLGLSSVRAETGDARTTEKPPADRILCDVPCSGYGVMRRKPELRYKTAAEIAGLPQIQYAILEASAAALKPGGVLVYSTCTLNKKENEAVVTRFLEAHPAFRTERPWQGHPMLEPFAGEMTTLFPAMLGSDGFFLCKMRRSG